MKTEAQKFIQSNIQLSSTGCWLWTKFGYGDYWPRIPASSKWYKFCGHTRVAVLAWTTYVGRLGLGEKLYKNCKTKHCVNPEHHNLKDGTQIKLTDTGFEIINPWEDDY